MRPKQRWQAPFALTSDGSDIAGAADTDQFRPMQYIEVSGHLQSSRAEGMFALPIDFALSIAHSPYRAFKSMLAAEGRLQRRQASAMTFDIIGRTVSVVSGTLRMQP
jgi:hypothetical protein